jgi:hypothetical protein
LRIKSSVCPSSSHSILLSIRSLVFIFNFSKIRHKNSVSFLLTQNGSLRHFLLLLKLLVSYYLNFRVIIESIANMMATIQNRVTILLSWYPF